MEFWKALKMCKMKFLARLQKNTWNSVQKNDKKAKMAFFLTTKAVDDQPPPLSTETKNDQIWPFLTILVKNVLKNDLEFS